MFLISNSCSKKSNTTTTKTYILQPTAKKLEEEQTNNFCLPSYGDRKVILQLNETEEYYEAFPNTGDLNGDGLADVIISRLQFQTYNTFELDILLNTGNGAMKQATTDIFSGSTPLVQHPTEVIVVDFNGDTQNDIFIANSGYDAAPQPGFQNALALSDSRGMLFDATGNLPQQNDISHSACAADIDNDDDIDLYVGNYWGQNTIDPQILINDGTGKFTIAGGNIPQTVKLSHNGYTTCAFTDVNNDGFDDLVLGHHEKLQHITENFSSEVLINNGKGLFSILKNAMPPKVHDQNDKAQDILPFNLNGDEYIDLIMVYERQSDASNYILALINNKDGKFIDESEIRLDSFYQKFWPNWRATSGNPRRTLEIRDFNRDGDLDLIAKTYNADRPEPLLFLNDGSGIFALQKLDYSMRGGDTSFAFIDLEGDGGLDIIFTLNFPPDYVEVVKDLGCGK